MNRPPESNTHSATSESPRVRTLLVGVGALLGLELYGGIFPSIDTWGFNRWSLAPGITMSIALAIAFAVPLVWPFFSGKMEGSSGYSGLSTRAGVWSKTVLFLAVTGITLYLLRSRTLLYGDGHTVVAHLAEGSAVILDQLKLQVGTIYLKRVLFDNIAGALGLSAFQFYSIFSVVGGIVGVSAIIRIAQIAGRGFSTATLFVGALSSGSVLLFFGHIEHYTWPLALGLWSLYYSLKSVVGDSFSIRSVIFASIASALHLIAIPFLFLALVIAFWKKYLKRDSEFRATARAVSLVALVGSVLIVGAFELFDLQPIFVRFQSSPDNSYTFSSSHHLKDLLNLIILLAPLALPFLATVFTAPRSLLRGTPTTRALGLAALICGLPALWIDPTLGMVRDWDLLSIGGIPLSLYFCARLQTAPFCNPRGALLPVTIAVLLAHIPPLVYERLDPQRTAEYLDSMLWQDAHYQTGYYDAERCLSFGSLLRTEEQRPDLAAKYFERRIAAHDDEVWAWQHLGEIAFASGDYDSAAVCFSASLAVAPNQPALYLRATQAYGNAGDYEQAVHYARLGVKFNPHDNRALYNLGILEYQVGRPQEAKQTLSRILHTDLAGSSNALYFYARAVWSLGDLDSAGWYMRRFLEFSPGNIEALIDLVELDMLRGDTAAARVRASQLERAGVSHPRFVKLKEKL